MKIIAPYYQSTARTPTAGTPHTHAKKEKNVVFSGNYVIASSRPPKRRPLKRCMFVPIPVIRKIAKVTVTNVPDVTEMVIFVKIVEMVKMAKNVEIGQMVK